MNGYESSCWRSGSVYDWNANSEYSNSFDIHVLLGSIFLSRLILTVFPRLYVFLMPKTIR